MFNLSRGDSGAVSVSYGLTPASPPRTTAWLCMGVGVVLVTAGVALETQNSAWLVMAALGLIFAGFGYLSQQLVAAVPWSLRQCRTWIAHAADRLAVNDHSSGVLLLLAAALWSTLTLVTAMAAVIWGDTAGLTVVCIGGLAAVLIEFAARRLYS